MKNPQRALQPARWLSRRQAAQLLGATESEVSKLDGRVLHPRRETDRSWRYDVAEVKALLAGGRSHERTGETPDGETTAALFELFEQHRSLPQVVIATKQPAAIALRLRREYDNMAGSLTLPADVLEELGTLLTVAPIAEPRGLVAALKQALVKRYQEGYQEGYQDGCAEVGADFGEVIDPQTGERRKVVGAVAGARTRPPHHLGTASAATAQPIDCSDAGKPPP